MASLICPVCETFTSSSNTTLNAHLDLCLSGESTIKWTAKSKVSKHKMEQTNMRSMVDIYGTAPYCTLEEGDRRNEINWASSSSLPAHEIETSDEERKKKAPFSMEDTNNEGSIYLNAEGKKLQTFSKFSDQSPEWIREHPDYGRLVKGDRSSEFLWKWARVSKKIRSPRPHRKFKIIGGQKQDAASEEICEKEGALSKRPKNRDQFIFNPQNSACTKNKEFQGENNESSPGNSCAKRGRLLRSLKSSGMISEPDDEYEDVEEHCLRKRARVCLMKSEEYNKANPNSSLSSHRVEMRRVLTRNGDRCVKSKQFLSKTKRFSSLRKNLVSVSHASASKRIRFPHKKVRVQRGSEVDKEAIGNNSAEYLNKFKARSKKKYDHCTNVRGKVKIAKKEETVVLKGSKLAPEYREHNDGDNFDLEPGNVLTSKDNDKDIQLCRKDNGFVSASDMVNEEASMLKSSDVRFYDVGGCSNFQSESRFPVEPILSGGGEIFCTDGGEINLGQNVHMGTELESQDGPGSFYDEVNSIDIPGPPGAVLPSTRFMASRNSAATSSLVQSSVNHPGFGGLGFVNSPSATSTISYSNVAKFNSVFLKNSPFGLHTVKSEIGSSVAGASVDARLNAAAALNSQEPPILWPKSVSLVPQSVNDNQMDVKNVTTYPLGHTRSDDSANSGVKSTSISYSVVRLMGKDIVVPLSPSQILGTVKRGEDPHSYTVSDVYSRNVQNKGGPVSSLPVVSQGFMFEPMQQNNIHVTLSNDYYGAPQGPRHGGLSPEQIANLQMPPNPGSSLSSTQWNYVLSRPQIANFQIPPTPLSSLSSTQWNYIPSLAQIANLQMPPTPGSSLSTAQWNYVPSPAQIANLQIPPTPGSILSSTQWNYIPSLAQIANLQMPPTPGSSLSTAQWNYVPSPAHIANLQMPPTSGSSLSSTKWYYVRVPQKGSSSSSTLTTYV